MPFWDLLALCGRAHCARAEDDAPEVGGQELVLAPETCAGMACLSLERRETPSELLHSERPRRAEGIQLGRVLGSGEYSTVYEALWGKETVAAKVLEQDKVANSGRDLDADFKREARILSGLSHPSCLRLLSVQPRTLVTPVVAGCTLAQRLYKQKLALEDPHVFARQLASCVSHLHHLLVLHRDLKPENLMVEVATRKLVVIDFGMAMRLSDADADGPRKTFDGSPLYASPEALLGAPLSLKQEVWALGCVLMEMFGSGRPYKQVRGLPELQQKLRSGVPPFQQAPLGLDADVLQHLQRCFSRTPARRPTAGELAGLLAVSEAQDAGTT